DQRLVLGPDGADDDLAAVAQLERGGVLARVGGEGQARRLGAGRTEQGPRVQGDDALRRRQQWVAVDLADLGEVDQQLSEADQQRLQCGQVDGLPAAHAL